VHQIGWEGRGEWLNQPSFHNRLTPAHRTLQEGVLSRNLVFPLDGSLAYLKFLYPESAEGVLTSEIPYLQEFSKNYQARKRVGAPLTPKKDEVEPFRECIREDLFRFVNDALNVKEYQDYARGSVSTSAPRFTKSTSLTSSRLIDLHGSSKRIAFSRRGAQLSWKTFH
jgi:hypothetical protein